MPAYTPPPAADDEVAYLFLDLDGFFAGVMQLDHPHLRGKPVVVCAVDTPSTACIASSYEAKALGIRVGTPVREAMDLSPDMHVMPADVPRFVEVHNLVKKAFGRCLPVEKVESIDEMWGYLIGDERKPENAKKIARKMKQAVVEEVGGPLSCSIGLAPNRWIGKICSGLEKPDGLVTLTKNDLPGPLLGRDLIDLPGISSNMELRLHRAGVYNVEQLYQQSSDAMYKIWGSVFGRMFHHWLRGDVWDIPESKRKQSLGHAHVLPPKLRTNIEKVREVAIRLISKAAARLRHEGYAARRMSLTIQYERHADRWVADIAVGLTQSTRTLIRHFNDLWPNRPRSSIPKKLGVNFYNLVPVEDATIPLFEEPRVDFQLDRVLDEINTKHGEHMLYPASMHDTRDAAPVRIAFNHIPGFHPAAAG